MREEGREEVELSPLSPQPFLPARQIAAQGAEVLEAVRVLGAAVQLREGELYNERERRIRLLHESRVEIASCLNQ